MVELWSVTKPSRSDEVLDAEQQVKIANQVRTQFDSLAPKRPNKPNRSEPDSTTTDSLSTVVSTTDQNIPEFDKFRSLQSQSHVRSLEHAPRDGANMVLDEFVETQYYNELVSIDKQHHTTGSGFIRATKEGDEENGFKIESRNEYGVGGRPAFKSNPATNDWIPSLEEDDQAFVSSKPNRSENC